MSKRGLIPGLYASLTSLRLRLCGFGSWSLKQEMLCSEDLQVAQTGRLVYARRQSQIDRLENAKC